MRRATHSSSIAATCVLAASTLLVFAAGSSALAGGLEVDRSVIVAGGGTSSGGNFSISGSMAQVDADPLQPSSGGVYTVTGGFWPGFAPVIQNDQLLKDGFEGP